MTLHGVYTRVLSIGLLKIYNLAITCQKLLLATYGSIKRFVAFSPYLFKPFLLLGTALGGKYRKIHRKEIYGTSLHGRTERAVHH